MRLSEAAADWKNAKVQNVAGRTLNVPSLQNSREGQDEQDNGVIQNPE